MDGVSAGGERIGYQGFCDSVVTTSRFESFILSMASAALLTSCCKRRAI